MFDEYSVFDTFAACLFTIGIFISGQELLLHPRAELRELPGVRPRDDAERPPHHHRQRHQARGSLPHRPSQGPQQQHQRRRGISGQRLHLQGGQGDSIRGVHNEHDQVRCAWIVYIEKVIILIIA